MSTCPIPSTAQAYSLNLSAVPYPGLGNPLGYLEVWPTDQMPANPVSTLNNLTGTVVANAAIVPAGTGGDITVYPSNDTDLVIDINGYFAPAGPGGLSLYPAAPCRVIDTRQIGSGQPFSGTADSAGGCGEQRVCTAGAGAGLCLQRDGGPIRCTRLLDIMAGRHRPARGLDA